MQHHVLYIVQHDEYIPAGQAVNQRLYNVELKGFREKQHYQSNVAVVPRFDSSSRKRLFSLSVFSDVISGPKQSLQRQLPFFERPQFF